MHLEAYIGYSTVVWNQSRMGTCSVAIMKGLQLIKVSAMEFHPTWGITALQIELEFAPFWSRTAGLCARVENRESKKVEQVQTGLAKSR